MSDRGNIIPDDKLGKAMNALYNVWFNKWRRMTQEMTPQLWDQCLDELIYITAQGNYEVVVQIGRALIEELDARWRDHYPDWEKDMRKKEAKGT